MTAMLVDSNCNWTGFCLKLMGEVEALRAVWARQIAISWVQHHFGGKRMSDFETLLSPSNVLLYGRVAKDFTCHFPAPPTTAGARLVDARLPGGNNFLQRQLQAAGATLARIYAFTYEGHYYDLPRPMIFLVHGDGCDPEPKPGASRGSRAPADEDRTGVASENYSFADDMKVWSYDKGDFSLRVDVETGTLEQILLDATLAGAGGTYAGANARIAGANVGANARNAGANVGANVGANARIRRGGGWSD